jgi:hypothetical protein
MKDICSVSGKLGNVHNARMLHRHGSRMVLKVSTSLAEFDTLRHEVMSSI